jgi:hypothetical protein
MWSVIRSSPDGWVFATWWQSSSSEAQTKPARCSRRPQGQMRPDAVGSNSVSVATPSTTRNAQLEPRWSWIGVRCPLDQHKQTSSYQSDSAIRFRW